ncbi:MAG TPA: type II toxin-antitoxin system MqsA family antitoxin [Nitrospira sp.]|nr:type II toxin-antitoxin system MqsA family antitoxin [Nitrospira sp.]
MMQCDFCGAQGAVIKKTTKSFGRGDNLVVIENIPTIHCSSCHGSYVTADTARELDHIRKNRRSLGKTKRVLVASFKKSAA